MFKNDEVFQTTRLLFPFSLDSVKLYFSAPVELYTVFSHPQNLAQNLGQRPGQKSCQHLAKKLGMPTYRRR